MPRRWYAGIDWSHTGHDVAVTDQHGALVVRDRVTGDPDGVRHLLRLLNKITGRRRRTVTVGIETGRGLFVHALLSAGQPVVVLNPTLVARYRSRLAVARKKSDKSDSLLLAHILRVDGAAHPHLPQISPQALAIRELARAQHHAVRARQRCQVQLAGLLADYHPAMLAACTSLPDGLAGPQARALLAAGPTPAHAARLTWPRLVETLQQAGRVRLVEDTADRLDILLRTRVLRQPKAVEEAMGHRARALLADLQVACANVDELTDRLEQMFTAHTHSRIYASFPGLGPVLGGRLLGELGDDLGRWQDARALKALCGATPLTWASGSSVVVRRRRNTSPLLLTTGHLWAFGALTRSPGARRHYDRRRASGDRHATALRHLYGRMLGQLHHCLTTNITYSESRAYPPEGSA